MKSGTILQQSVLTTLTTIYNRLNKIDLARTLFDESLSKTVLAWNAISSYKLETKGPNTKLCVDANFLQRKKRVKRHQPMPC